MLIGWQRYRNLAVKSISNSKKEFYKNVIDSNKTNPKELWRNLKEIMGRKEQKINGVICDNKYYHRALDIANVLNNYYVESIDTIIGSIDNSHNDENALLEMIPAYSCSFFQFKQISLENLRKMIYNQHKNGSIDEIDLKIIKELFHVIGYPLRNLINLSLEKGTVPDRFKTSVIISVPKVPNTNLAQEMRPINMLPFCEKLLELTVYDQMLEYIKDNNLLCTYQSGFRDKHSCETALQCVISDWKDDINERRGICAVFLDLKRAFETIDRHILILKLKKYGFSGIVLRWLENYLDFRYQKTKYDNTYSESRHNDSGVPQGSVLGPLLFIMYINDLGSTLVNCKIHLFADDTLIYFSHQNYEILIATVNDDLKILTEKFKINRLKINEMKSKCMFIGSDWAYKKFCSLQLKIKINNKELAFEDDVKYLGLLIDRNLKFKKHVDYVSKKIGKKIGYFYRVSNHLNLETRISLYNSIILPHFNYCSSVIYTSSVNCHRLQILQNKAMRFILGVNRYTSINSMLEVLGWFNVQTNLFIKTMIFIYKLLNNMIPGYLSSRVVRVNTIHTYNTRNCNNYYVNYTTCTLTKNSLFYKGIIKYNSLPNDLKVINNVRAFKQELIKFVKNLEIR